MNAVNRFDQSSYYTFFSGMNRLVVLAWCVLLYGFWLFQSTSFPAHDFSNYYFGSHFFLQEGDAWGITDPYTFNQKIWNEGYRNIFVNFNPNPPFVLLFFIPFVLLPLAVSKFVFNLITLALFLVSLYRICKLHNISWKLVFVCTPILFFVPIRNEILFGQVYFLLFFLLAEGYIAYSKKQWLPTSVFWSFAILLKVFPVLIFLMLVLKKEWKPALYLGLSCSVLLLVSIGVQGIDLWQEYFFEILQRASRGEIAEAFTQNYQSAFFLFKYAFISDPLSNPSPALDSPFLFNLCWMLFKSVVLAMVASVILKREDFLSFATVLLGSLLITSYGSTYAIILIIFIWIACFRHYASKQMLIITVLVFLISNLPITIFSSFPLLFQFPRLLLFTALGVFLIYISNTRFRWGALLIFFFLSVTSFFLKNSSETDHSKYLLKSSQPVLIFDYTIEKNKIVYRYWDTAGLHQEILPILANPQLSTELSIIDNQINYRGTMLTSSADRKTKARLLDATRIVYLSDKGRGPGFYTLRVIKLTE